MGCAPATLDPVDAISQSLLSIGAIVGINRVGCGMGLPLQFQARKKFRACDAYAL
jgi:hypothetical protein